MSWAEVLKSLAFWGPGAILAGLMIWSLYRLADKFIEKFAVDFINAQRAQAESLAKMAQGTEGLSSCVTNYFERDNKEHREIIILLKVITEKLEDLEGARGG
jgi:hypothetical protein